MAADKQEVLPKVVAFDLDATLWYPEMYQLWGGGSPFKKNNDKTLTDRSGTRCYLMGNTAEILREIKTSPRWKGAKIAYCSCTDEPTWADECMRLFEIGDGMTLESVVDIKEIFKSSKSTHFRNIHKKTGIPYEDMIFFDNEAHNCHTVAPLGVTCIHTPRGMTEEVWKNGLRQFAKNRGKK
ncbi:hypothetical protein GUITHDRAFT_143640 [Guillardia theta CCMP2712]|uniref:Magnesium-dependent phosphatase-1 n=1 Tax=Guillardia theta (strain CCMP2712) TaxID=905079 RepID=L1IT04_GUITC|nr:hypothetical protein GUITHDRAFT_143640 [Guillardia theta CCMP2712]EKX39232.1 hypothetical protein GUITHDRAFT_143640 [Guillardia theta CCMP2712]|mmetsp:Transcript_48166/g.151096  ORF Transcript_48166/g.151096 Transcript_48166/m.151096 type:complete len:182 (-) Transcript_48166:33-578(-)|eukprot:XP_005826212.1 hypothetical protein GUITHDRAFT_143640 [Guillardia theta CCMP2712]